MQSCLPSADAAIRAGVSPESWTPAGTVVLRAAGLRVHGMTVTAEGGVPGAGELAVFCRPVVTAPAAHHPRTAEPHATPAATRGHHPCRT